MFVRYLASQQLDNQQLMEKSLCDCVACPVSVKWLCAEFARIDFSAEKFDVLDWLTMPASFS